MASAGPRAPGAPSRARAKLLLWLSALSLAFLALAQPLMVGDIDEYMAMTVAIAAHGSPEIRIDDLARARSLLPQYAPLFDAEIAAMRESSARPAAALWLGRDGQYHAIHFPGYSALAAAALAGLSAAGLPPLKCFQLVNVAFLFVLGTALFRLLPTPGLALGALALYLLSGGALYAAWSSPETMSAAALLAAMVFLATGAPLRAGVLAGLAAAQNPPIALFFPVAPLLVVALHRSRGPAAALRELLQPRLWAGLGLGLAIFASSLLCNLSWFGTPSMIAVISTDPGLQGWDRLHSFYLDLNQGMAIGVPGVVVALALAALQRRHGAAAGGPVAVLAIAFSIAMALPALSTTNWNSGAAGEMRYALWASMPLLFLCAWLASRRQRLPRGLLLGVFLLQGAATLHAAQYSHLQFSPLARWVLQHAPSLYHPDPEIFAERTRGTEGVLARTQVFQYPARGPARKWLAHSGNLDIDLPLCGAGASLAADTPLHASSQGWVYIDGAGHCVASEGPRRATAIYTADRFGAAGPVRLASGWGSPHLGGGMWNGVWSVGPRSRLVVAGDAGAAPQAISVSGFYLAGNRRTRVWIDGADRGWLDLAAAPVLRLDARTAGPVTIDLEHQAPHSPGPQDPRALAFFLQEVRLR